MLQSKIALATIISAVGHETDTTIADYVADLRAPTPSAAAELAVFEYNAFVNDINMYRYELMKSLNHKLEYYRNRTKYFELRLKNLSPQNILMQKIQYIADIETKLNNRIENILMENKHKLAIFSEKLNGLSPLNKLSNGYAYIDDKNKKSIKTVEDVKKNDEICIHLMDGIINTVVTEVKKQEV